MFNYLKLIALSSLLLVGGCAHNIQMTPSIDNLRNNAVKTKSELNVGYYISAEDMARAVTSPGGGGDKVTYFPYKDTEAALNTVLSQIFQKVYAAPALTDSSFMAQKQIAYVFKPQITTTSSSASAFTWPPTDFTVTLFCSAVDASGQEVWKDQVTGQGHSEFSEFKSDFSLTARRAAEDAFKKLQEKIANSSLVLKK